MHFRFELNHSEMLLPQQQLWQECLTSEKSWEADRCWLPAERRAEGESMLTLGPLRRGLLLGPGPMPLPDMPARFGWLPPWRLLRLLVEPFSSACTCAMQQDSLRMAPIEKYFASSKHNTHCITKVEGGDGWLSS